MKIAVACDHRGYEAKRKLLPLLKKMGHEVCDFGCEGTTAVDYPDMAAPAARAVSSGDYEVGVLLDGSGIGMCVAAVERAVVLLRRTDFRAAVRRASARP